jgi:hypothetical protein
MSLSSKILKFIYAAIPEHSISRLDGVIQYGRENILPNTLLNAVSSSGTATSCVTKIKQFVEADGFTNEASANLKVNPTQTADSLLAEMAYQLALFSGFVLNIKYRLDGKVGAVYLVPLQQVRKMDDGCLCYNDTYGTDHFKKNSSIVYPCYSYMNEIDRVKQIDAQMKEHGKQIGEMLYVYVKSPYSQYYPVPDWSSALNDVLSDGALANLENRNITRGFRPNVIISTVGDIDNKQKDDFGKTDSDHFDDNLKEFTGEDASTVLVLNASTREQLPEILVYPLAEMLDAVDGATNRVAHKVARNFGVPPVLIGLKTDDGLGNSQAIQNSMKLFSSVIIPYQNLCTKAFEMLYKDLNLDWTIGSLNIFGVDPAFFDVLTNEEKRELIGYSNEEPTEPTEPTEPEE